MRWSRSSPGKVDALVRPPKPTNVKEVAQFLGLAGYIHSYIAGYISKAAFIAQLLKKGEPFLWGAEQDTSNAMVRYAVSNAAHIENLQASHYIDFTTAVTGRSRRSYSGH